MTRDIKDNHRGQVPLLLLFREIPHSTLLEWNVDSATHIILFSVLEI